MHLRKKQPFFDKDIVDDRVIRKPALKQIPSERESIFKMMIAAVPFLVVFFLATSFITTQTFTFGYPLPSTQKLYKQYLKEKPTKTFTVEELSKYDGTNPDLPVYISLLGQVFDVSAKRDTYARGGGYGFFSGRDASRSFVTGCFDEPYLSPDVRDFTAEQMKEWVQFYHDHDQYEFVGTLLLPEIPKDAPPPPDCKKKQQ